MEGSFFDRDISWLSFNHRVLMESGDENVPLLERLKFLSIYSSNLDEFYRVRIPALLSLKKMEQDNPVSPYTSLLAKMEDIVLGQMKDLGAILELKIIPALRAEKIHLVYNEPIPAVLQQTCTAYFFNQVAGFLHPAFLSEKDLFVENNKLQLLVLLNNLQGEEQTAVVNIPVDFISRFYFQDDIDTGTRYIIFLDDIIKANLDKIFPGYVIKGSYSFKITRDAELDLEDEYDGDLADKIQKQLKKRDSGLATRFLYQPGIPLRSLYAVINKLNLTNANAVPGGNYHNLKNLSAIPLPAKQNLSYEEWKPVTNKHYIPKSIFDSLAGRDMMIHTPYQDFIPVIRFFNEASLDNNVEEIYLTVYRVAHDSMIGNALMNAVKNGKKVTVFVELKARFDEENNLAWAGKMKAAGVKIIYSIPNFKVHAKMALVKRREAGRLKFYGLLSSGNFNENTARLYTDHILLTAHPGITGEMDLLFMFLGFRVQPKKYQALHFEHLLVAQFNLQQRFLDLIDQEIQLAKKGINAAITIKINGLEDKILINKLYEASNAGVKIKLIVRSVCCIIPGVPNMSENISVIRIVDRFLEHGRIFIFNNNNEPLVFTGSSDWMNKSMYRRIEVCYPVYDEMIKKELIHLIEIQLADNQKAVALNEQMQNIFIKPVIDQAAVRSQEAIYRLLKT